MSDLVDSWRFGLAGVVTDTEGEIAQLPATFDDFQLKDHAESSGRSRHIDLETVRQQGAIATFGITAPQIIAWHAVTFIGTSRSPSDIRASGVSLFSVRVKRGLVEDNRRMAPLVDHD